MNNEIKTKEELIKKIESVYHNLVCQVEVDLLPYDSEWYESLPLPEIDKILREIEDGSEEFENQISDVHPFDLVDSRPGYWEEYHSHQKLISLLNEYKKLCDDKPMVKSEHILKEINDHFDSIVLQVSDHGEEKRKRHTDTVQVHEVFELMKLFQKYYNSIKDHLNPSEVFE